MGNTTTKQENKSPIREWFTTLVNDITTEVDNANSDSDDDSDDNDNKKKLYVLRLEKDKYYVGVTEKKVEERFKEHEDGTGSAWTSMYKPIKIIKIVKNVDEYDEDKYTKMYMDKYGIENVRGGSYITVKLEDYQKRALEKELCTTNDKCFRCGREGHYVKNCYARTDVNGILLKK